MYLDLQTLEHPQTFSSKFKGRCVVHVAKGCEPFWDGPEEESSPKPRHLGNNYYLMPPGPWMFYGGSSPVRVEVFERKGQWAVCLTRKIVMMVELEGYTPPILKPRLRLV